MIFLEDFPLTDYLTEQEQIEILKNWIKQYSLVILAGAIIAFGIISGWHYWQQRQAKILSRASAIYDEMLTRRAQNDAGATLIQARKLYKNYPRTVYGQMGALMLARDSVLKKDYVNAEKRLNWVINHSSVPSLRQIARIRLARVYISEQKPEDALTTLEKINDQNFNGLINEVRGDAYVAMKKYNMARDSYKQALNELPNAEVIRPLLEMKYNNLATLG